MILNLVKYFVQTRFRLLGIKITSIILRNYYFVQNIFLEILLFYISQTKSSLAKIFCKVMYHHIIYMCDFSNEFRRS
jgi:hypothetical protein